MASVISSPSPHHQRRWSDSNNNAMRPPQRVNLQGGGPHPKKRWSQPQQQHPRHVVNAQSAPTRASSFAAVKSPISHCIDTIIGAAEVLAERDEYNTDRRYGASVHSYFDATSYSSVDTSRHPPVPSQRGRKSGGSTGSRKSSKAPTSRTSKAPTITAPSSATGTGSVFMDPLEELLEDDQELHKKLILTMALQRPRQPPNPHPTKQPSRIIEEGFYWKEYPALEDVLYENMEEYFEWSTRQRQSKQQQKFNNLLVNRVREVAVIEGCQFCPTHFTDKRLRDRIRCFYKTHLQNAKKRLQTMRKHLGSDEHRATLEGLIEQARSAPAFQGGLVPVVSHDDDEEEEDQVPKRKRQRSR